MKPMIADMTNDDRCWQAVCERDASADGQFVFAVLTTGVCCRPSCRSRRALRENVRFYADVEAAKAAGYRPKTVSAGYPTPDQQRVESVAAAHRLLDKRRRSPFEALRRSSWRSARFISIAFLNPSPGLRPCPGSRRGARGDCAKH